MFNSTVIQSFREAGASLALHGREELALSDLPEGPSFLVQLDAGEHTARFAVATRSAAPYPGQMPHLTTLRDRLVSWGNPLLYAPYITEGQGRALTEFAWSWVDELGNFDVRTGDIVLRNRSPRPRGRGRRSSNALPRGWAGLRVVRTLTTAPIDPVLTSTLARAAEISAPRTSQVLHQLQDHGYVSKGSDSSWEVDRAALLELFLGEYQGPGGDDRWFYALDLNAATEAITDHAELEPVFSGDVAADLLAPHRRPSHLVAYVCQGSLSESDVLVETSTAADANVVVTRPRDTSVFPVVPLRPSKTQPAIYLAEPTQVAWDLQRLGGDDRLEQLEELRTWILRSR